MVSHKTHTKVQLPKSTNSGFINFIGMMAFAICIMYFRDHRSPDMVFMTVMSVMTYGICIIALEVILLRSPARPTTGLSFEAFNWSADRIFFKLVGLAACYGFIALAFWHFNEYAKQFFNPFWHALDMVLPYLAILAVPYVALVDSYMKEPEDNYYHLGVLILTFKRGTSWKAIGQLFLGWVVKAYFLPLMFIYMINDVHFLVDLDLTHKNITFLNVFYPAVRMLFVLDLLAAVAGYGMTFRLFDTHIRSVEPTFKGWFVCVLCYAPFNSVYFSVYGGYRGSDNRWVQWLDSHPYVLMIWGSVTFLAILVYCLAGINFGVRFSNISHRCVLTSGMYRLTKHPEYVSKNFYWWTTYVPFLTLNDASGFHLEDLRWSILMLLVNLIYFLRARTEEAHMSHDRTYVEYALWMNEYGAFAWLGRLIPFFKYTPPADWEHLPEVYTGIK